MKGMAVKMATMPKELEAAGDGIGGASQSDHDTQRAMEDGT
jgi:hypothetical protein